MNVYEQISLTLDKIDKTINTERDLTVKALGLLFMGQEFFDEMEKEEKAEVKDPTEVLLGNFFRDPPGLGLPNL